MPCLVVLDNASIHRSGAFREKLADWQQRGIYLHFFPPYSPELNLIEMLWRKVKYRMVAVGCLSNLRQLEEVGAGNPG